MAALLRPRLSIVGGQLLRFQFTPIHSTNTIRLYAMTAKYPQRKIGDDSVSAEGLGCMGMSFSYTSFGGFDNEQSYEVLSKAADLGVSLWSVAIAVLESIQLNNNQGYERRLWTTYERAAHWQMVQGDRSPERDISVHQVW